jgi:hypothetical protein
MAVMYVVAILLILNILLTNPEVIGKIYTWSYTKLKRPRFSCGELVMIQNREFEVVFLTKHHRPYTYFCIPLYGPAYAGNYYHESDIDKKTGILKELE